MPRGPNEDPDLALVEALLFAGRGLQLRKFNHTETVAGRTPDFRVIRCGTLVAYCEVKSPRDDWLEEQIEQAAPGEIAGGLRNDPIFNRIARHIQKAATQFDAVNQDRAVPNVLVFVNHDDASNYGDLRETVTGTFFPDDGSRHLTMPNISEGRLGKIKTRIDLYAWIDAPTKRVQGYIFSEAAPQHVQVVCDLLGLDVAKIEH